jgi:hypothetical protein
MKNPMHGMIVLVVLLFVAIVTTPLAFKRSSGYGSCYKCGQTWEVVRGHDTPYEWTQPGEMAMLTSGQTVSAKEFFGGNVPKELEELLSKPQPVRSCFPLCEGCWSSLSPQARVRFYRRLVDEWKRSDPAAETKWPAIEASVLAGN